MNNGFDREKCLVCGMRFPPHDDENQMPVCDDCRRGKFEPTDEAKREWLRTRLTERLEKAA